MKIRSSILIGISVICASLYPGLASADVNITVSNASFEILPAAGLPFSCPGAGCSFSEDSIAGWVNTGVSGQFKSGNSYPNAYLNYLPDGIYTGYTNGPTISQTVTPTVQVGDVYSMFVYIANRAGYGLGTADLLINGTKYAATGTVAASGDWSQWTATYSGVAADAGKSITIELNKGLGLEGNFDLVSLSDAPAAPEPASYAALLFVLGSVMLVVRSRRAKQRAASMS